MPSYGVAIALLVAVLLAACAGSYYSRRQALEHRVGAFACRLFRTPDASYASLGVAQYGVKALVWYRRHSLSPRPARVWQREQFTIVTREMITQGAEAGMLRVRCRCGPQEFTLVMSRSAYAGLAGWLEAGPHAHLPLQS